MTDRPILFSAPMIRAILAGSKTQTRRILKPQIAAHAYRLAAYDPRGTAHFARETGGLQRVRIPAARGDLLWVREAWNQFSFSQDGDEAWPVAALVPPAECKEIDDEGYRVSAPQIVHRASERADRFFQGQRWRPSIHMPRWASRITLQVTDVKVERLVDISSADTIAEGVRCQTCQTMNQSACSGLGCFASRKAFSQLWESINGPGSWDTNPWVAVIAFEPVFKNIDEVAA